MRKRNLIFLVLSVCLSASAEDRPGPLSCNSDDKIFSQTIQRGIGREFSGSDECLKALKQRGANTTCSEFDNGFYGPYSLVSGRAIGEFLNEWGKDVISNDFDWTECLAATKAENGVVCSRNHVGGVCPYPVKTEQCVGHANGFSNWKDCISSTRAASLSTVCNWDGEAFRAYSLEDGEVVASFGGSLAACQKFTTTPGARNPPRAKANQLVAWQPDGKTCAVFTRQGERIRILPKTDACRESQLLFDPDLKTFLATLPATAGRPTPGYTWKKCERPDADRATMPIDASGKFRPECAPDTLYSWHSEEAVQKLVAAQKANSDRPFPVSYFYLWRTPLGTFGYGIDLVRVKLKKGVHFKEIDENSRKCPVNPEEDKSTVYISRLENFKGWNEYILCSGEPVASWSHDTPEGFTEMQAEKDWVENHNTANFDAILRPSEDKCMDCPLWRSEAEGDWSLPHLQGIFQTIERNLAQSPQGEVFFAPGESQNRSDHFSTRMPGYFNRQAGPP